MKNPSRSELIAQLKQVRKGLYALQKQCDDMMDLLVYTDDNKEWFSTQEAASLAGIKPKTATNYASSGKWGEVKKMENGRVLIHRSALEDYLND